MFVNSRNILFESMIWSYNYSISFSLDVPSIHSLVLLYIIRTSPAEFIVPFDEYMEAVKNSYPIGMRFKMRFEGEEAPEQR